MFIVIVKYRVSITNLCNKIEATVDENTSPDRNSQDHLSKKLAMYNMQLKYNVLMVGLLVKSNCCGSSMT